MSSIRFNVGSFRVDGNALTFGGKLIGTVKDMRICPDDELRSRSFIYFEPNGAVDIKALGREISLFGIALMCALPGKEILGTYQVPSENSDKYVWKVTVKKGSLCEEDLWD